jgi:ADP-heptose:LPS heptosyltransferase
VHGASNPRVVLLFPGALGDFLLALPTLRALRARHPGADATLAVAGSVRAIARLARVADTTASLDDADTAGLFGGTAVPRWFGERPIVYSWIGRDDAAVRARLGDLAARVTFAAIERGDGDAHAAVAYARVVGVGLSDGALATGARVEAVASADAAAVLAPLRRPCLAIHGGAGGRAKRWDPTGYAAVARSWARRHGDVVSIVGPADLDLPDLPSAITIRGWELPGVAALLAGVDAFAGNDGGIAHLAAAVGARGVAIFGPTAAGRWRPLGDRIVPVVSRDRAGALDVAALPVADVLERLDACLRLDKPEGHP